LLLPIHNQPMPNCELIRFESPDALARGAALRWLEELAARGNFAPSYCVALSGGRIAKAFFASIAGHARRPASFDSVHFFWADERCVPPDDSESNFRLAKEALLDPLAVAAANLHRVRGELPPPEAATEAEAQLRRIAPADPTGLPRFDLVFLGMGEDGHVASLFPGGSEQTSAKDRAYFSVIGTKPPPRRVTLGYAAIAAAQQVWVLASGPGKETALRDSLSPQGRTPLARVLRAREQTRVLTDIGAA
jgi:6-phosphogluconolactonase